MGDVLRASAIAAGVLLMSAVSASAQTVVATATLHGGEETPAALLTGAVGTAEASIDLTAREFAVTLRAFNLPTGTTAAHIHIGSRGVAGPVVIDVIQAITGGNAYVNIHTSQNPAGEIRGQLAVRQ